MSKAYKFVFIRENLDFLQNIGLYLEFVFGYSSHRCVAYTSFTINFSQRDLLFESNWFIDYSLVPGTADRGFLPWRGQSQHGQALTRKSIPNDPPLFWRELRKFVNVILAHPVITTKSACYSDQQ